MLTPRRPAGEAERFAMTAAADVLGVSQVHPDADLWSQGLDEAMASELAATLADAGWPGLDSQRLLGLRSPAAIARERPRDVLQATATVTFNSSGGRPPLFAIPGSGGTALAYWWLARELGEQQPIVVCEPHGLRSTGWADFTVERAARRVVREVVASLTPGRVVLTAYSAGGMIAVETARQLGERGYGAHVVLLDCTIGDTAGRAINPPPRDARTKARRAFMRAWLRVLPARTVPPVLRYRAYFHIGVRARRRYTESHPTFPVTLFHPVPSDYAADWADSADPLTVVPVPGDHYTMIEPPHVAVLAQEMRRILAG